MMRRLWCALASLAILAGGCGGDDDPSTAEDPTSAPTSEPASTTSEESPSQDPELEDVNLMRCLDPECSRIQIVKLDEQVKSPESGLEVPVGSPQIGLQDFLARSDGRPLVVAEAVTHGQGDGDTERETLLYSCVDPACSAVTAQVVGTGHNYRSGALLPDGSLAIAYQTGQQLLCPAPGSCSDPERDDLSSLELLICSNPDDCSAAAEQSRIVVLDREGLTGQRPKLLVDPSGTPAVVYQREVDDGVAEIRLARCRDPSCTDVSVDVLTAAESGGFFFTAGRAAASPDGSPVFMHHRVLPDHDEIDVVACEDPACETSAIAMSIGSVGGTSEFRFPMGLAVAEDGVLFVPVLGPIFEDGVALGNTISVVSCLDSACDASVWSPILHEVREVVGVDQGVVDVLPDGRLIFHWAAIAEGEISSFFVTVCDDRECSSATSRSVDDPGLFTDAWDPDTPPGLFMFQLQTDADEEPGPD